MSLPNNNQQEINGELDVSLPERSHPPLTNNCPRMEINDELKKHPEQDHPSFAENHNPLPQANDDLLVILNDEIKNDHPEQDPQLLADCLITNNDESRNEHPEQGHAPLAEEQILLLDNNQQENIHEEVEDNHLERSHSMESLVSTSSSGFQTESDEDDNMEQLMTRILQLRLSFEDEDSAPEPEPDYEEEPPPDPSAVLPGIVRSSFAPDGSDADSRREDDANDCLTDRQAVLDEQKAGGAALYVPECTGDGRYARAQCYRSTGYCWCVHQDTGKPIPGSSVKDRRPDCDSAPQHASPMRGCPEPMKTRFLHDLMSFFISKMTTSINGTGPGEMVKWGASKEEQAATWTYVMLDKDKNKALERREWKAFHQLISNVEPLRRCGRKLPRYCDVNHDTKISITEWMACLEVMQGSQGITTEATKPPSNPRRKGPNPLESILKADD